MNKRIVSLAMAAASLLGAALLSACDDVKTDLKAPVYKTALKEDETRMSAFKAAFPNEYASYQKNNETKVMTDYKGSIAYHKNDNVNPLPQGFKHAQPYLKNLWLGYPFSFEYNEARGHTYAIDDFVNIDRLNRYGADGKALMPTTCWNCKTPKMMIWYKQYGDKLWSMDANEFRAADKISGMDETINCANCHNPTNMELRLYSEPLNDWLKRTNQDWNKISRNEKRSLVCAQCHSEYYFTHKDNGPAAKPVFPWDEGMGADDMYRYYMGHGAKDASGNPGPFVDFKHAASGVPIIKMQHPDYEMFVDGPHGAAGVACADCHMQYQRVDGKKISSHWMTSPLKDQEMRACRQCHADKTADFLRERVIYSQKKVFDQLIKAEALSVKAHEAVRIAGAYAGDSAADYDTLMKQAVEMVRKGQLFWDYVSAENSVGFHNPAKSLDTLATSMESSRIAVDLASQATNYGISSAISGDIEKIVPPILEHSRKLMQSPEHLQNHPWLKLLKPFPTDPQVWEGQTRLTSEATAK
ncbi:MAG: ammonia-forming cytochrome c nitrite reductase subunit c552 [Desulfovibrio sp.]|jgi:nitrite reductase (cytochrome c-552)|nr:ammonia-forming cytochrome c nitrite reductase subunit c552 [Desulfovibrio sp.]